MENDKWVSRWAVRSSSGHGDYIIGRDAEGKYGCTCLGWTRNVTKICAMCGWIWSKPDQCCAKCGCIEHCTERKDCTHIIQVKHGRGRTISEAVFDRMAGR